MKESVQTLKKFSAENGIKANFYIYKNKAIVCNINKKDVNASFVDNIDFIVSKLIGIEDSENELFQAARKHILSKIQEFKK